VRKHGKDGLIVIGVHDANRGWDKAPAAHRSKQMAYSIGLDNGGTSARAWGVSFWPTYAVIDRKGVVRAVGLRPDAVEQVATKLLAEKPEGPAPTPASTVAGTSVDANWLEGTASARQRLDALAAAPDAPALAVTNWINSPPLQLEALAGKVILLDFFTPTREASMRAMRRNNELFERHRADGLIVIGVCHTDAADRVAAAADRLKIAYPLAVDSGRRTSEAYRVDNYPDSYLIDRAGRLRIADCKEAKVEDAVKVLLAEPAPAAAPTEPPAKPAAD
jgi:peroxiredoxin